MAARILRIILDDVLQRAESLVGLPLPEQDFRFQNESFGVLWHFLEDRFVYSRCVIEAILENQQFAISPQYGEIVWLFRGERTEFIKCLVNFAA